MVPEKKILEKLSPGEKKPGPKKPKLDNKSIFNLSKIRLYLDTKIMVTFLWVESSF